MRFSTDPTEIKKIVVDASSNDVHLILPIFPLGKKAKPPDDFAIDDDFQNAYNRLQRAIGKADLTLMKTLDNKFAHPRSDALGIVENYKMQSHYSLGKLEYVFPKPDEQRRVWGSYNVVDPTGKQVCLKYMENYNKGVLPLFTSSQIVRDRAENKWKIREFDLMHTTLTDEPAFGKELSGVSAVCQGDIKSCVMNYAAASNTVAEIGLNVRGDVVEAFHSKETCPFCVETELTNLFENNRKVSEYILNSASIPKMPEEQQKVITPDEDQSRNNPSRAPIDVEKLSGEVAKKVAELNKQNEITSTMPEPKAPAIEPKPTSDIENNPVVKDLLKKVSELSDNYKIVTETLKQKDELINSLTAKTNENDIGDILAAHERNFYDPETKKVDPAKWEAAFLFAKENNLTPTQLKNYLEKFSPYGTKAVEKEAPMMTNKASTNKGVPKFNAAFDNTESAPEEKKEILSASTNRVEGTPTGVKLVRSFITTNNLD